jgi:hypothetical protein
VSAGRSHGIANYAVGIVGTLEPGRIGFDEGLEEGERGRRILPLVELGEAAIDGLLCRLRGRRRRDSNSCR